MSSARRRHPAKTHHLGPNGPTSPGTRRPTKLTAQHIDLWEHAALLYHSYEWQAAADTFTALASDVEDVEMSSRCCVNSVLIQARLGDFRAAQNTLQTAIMAESIYLLAVFVAGLIAYEFHDRNKAERCFELCFDGLRNQEDLVFGCWGLDFVLEREVVRGNLRALRSGEFRARVMGSHAVPMNGVPAEFIFEAPLREGGSDGVRGKECGKEMTVLHQSTVKAAQRLECLRNSPLTANPSESRHLSPRDPRGEYYSTQELAWFLDPYAPDTCSNSKFNVSGRQVFRSKTTHDDEGMGPTCKSQHVRAGANDLRAMHSSYETPRTATGSYSPQSSAKSISTELLLPTIYSPLQTRMNNHPLNSPSSPVPPQNHPTHPAPAPPLLRSKTTASPQTQRAREMALRALEGRIRPQSARAGTAQSRELTWIELNKPLPPVPVPGSWGAGGGEGGGRLAVRTENFFETVLGKV